MENQELIFTPTINHTSRKMDPFSSGCEAVIDRVDNLLAFKECRDTKIEMMRNNIMQKELYECTFRPKINHKKQ